MELQYTEVFIRNNEGPVISIDTKNKMKYISVSGSRLTSNQELDDFDAAFDFIRKASDDEALMIIYYSDEGEELKSIYLPKKSIASISFVTK